MSYINNKNNKVDEIEEKFNKLNIQIEDKYEKCKIQIEKNFIEKLQKNEEDAFKKYEKWVVLIYTVYKCIT